MRVRDGVRKTNTETHSKETALVVGPVVIPYLQRHWEALVQGKTVNVRFASVERMETLGFEISKFGEGTFFGREAIQLKMRPSSFIIAAILGNPIIFTMRKDDKNLIAFQGRTCLKEKKYGSWRDFDAESVYLRE